MITWRGRKVCACTPPVVEAAEAILGYRLVITQGGYNAGGVVQSAGTHDGGGVGDVSTRDLNDRQEIDVVKALRTVGGWAWLRPLLPNWWAEHIHFIIIGCPHLSPNAKLQERDAYNGIDGLKGHTTPDPHRNLGIKPRLYSDYLEDDVITEADKREIAKMASDMAYEKIGSTLSWFKENYWGPTRTAALAAAGGPPADVDEDLIVDQLLEQLGPDLARQVADTLAKRLLT